MDLLIRNALLDGHVRDIGVDGGRIVAIGANVPGSAATHVIEADGLAAVPALVNGHTHAAMTLLRGYGDDMLLQPWLAQKVWPFEAVMTSDDIYWGTKLACLEMIKSGTTLFYDMYLDPLASLRAVQEMGMRAIVSPTLFDFLDSDRTRQAKRDAEATMKALIEATRSSESGLVIPSIAAHSIYTVSTDLLQWVADFGKQHHLLVHIHLSETAREVEDSLKQFGGRPTYYLDGLGFWNDHTIAAHCQHLTRGELDVLAEHNVIAVHNPVANMKLASGPGFPFADARKRGVRIVLGTDGPSSNNSLDLFQDMKLAALLQKQISGDPTLMSADEIYTIASKAGFAAFGIEAGRVAVGQEADFLLVRLDLPEMVPLHNLQSNLVYAASGYCVDTTICAGKVLMEHRQVADEERILRRAAEVAYAAAQRVP